MSDHLAATPDELDQPVVTGGPGFQEPVAIAEPIPASAIVEELEYDVVVVGAGAAGVPAALSAAELGASVAVLQKAGKAVSQGNMATGLVLAESDAGGPARAVAELLASNAHRSDRMLLEVWARRSGETMEWLVRRSAEGGFRPSEWTVAHGDPANRTAYTVRTINYGPKPKNEAHGMQALASVAEREGVDFFYKTPGMQLVREDGRVVGVIGKREDGGFVRVNARKGVILATGDYQNNAAMVAAYLPDIAPFWKKQSGRTGDGHLMGLAAGAVMEPLPHTKMLHDFDAGPYAFEPFLATSMLGERFMNEEVAMELVNNYRRTAPEPGRYCQIWDAGHAAQVQGWGGKPVAEEFIRNYMPEEPGEKTAVFRALTHTYRADTLAGLAEKLGIPADALERTVAEYNALCARGTDTAFGKRPQYLQPVVTPPFYGVRRRLGVSATVCGLIVNEHSQCLDAAGAVIPGLYAAGNCSGPFYGGVDYPLDIPGLSLGRAHTFGRVAGQHAAKG